MYDRPNQPIFLNVETNETQQEYPFQDPASETHGAVNYRDIYVGYDVGTGREYKWAVQLDPYADGCPSNWIYKYYPDTYEHLFVNRETGEWKSDHPFPEFAARAPELAARAATASAGISKDF